MKALSWRNVTGVRTPVNVWLAGPEAPAPPPCGAGAGEPYRTIVLTERASTGGRDDARGYGYGWFVGAVGSQLWFHHSGDNPGFRAFDACLPDLDCRIVLLSNPESTSVVRAVRELVQVAQAGTFSANSPLDQLDHCAETGRPATVAIGLQAKMYMPDCAG